MYKAFNYRIYPNKEQQELLEKHFGCARYIYNWALDTKQKTYQSRKISLSVFDLTKKLPELKKELQWLTEVNSVMLQDTIFNLEAAFQSFFKKQNYFPKFKKKVGRQSFSFSQINNKSKIDGRLLPTGFYIKDGKLKLMKFKSLIKIKIDRPFEGAAKSITVKKMPSGKYFVSILCEIDILPNKSSIIENTTVGVDLGIKTFATLSTGGKIENPKFLLNSLFRLKVLQRRASKKQRGSNNRKKANKKVALLHEKIANQRKDFLQKLTTKLIRENQTICLETLNVKGMLQNHKLAKSISDVAWSEFNRMLDYKAEWNGNNIIRIGQFEPSSKLCTCGVKNTKLTLADRIWTCSSCGAIHDRDVLAANNIKHFGLIQSQ